MADPAGSATAPRPTRGIRSRITLVGPGGRVDLAAPTGEAVTAWLPAALRHLPAPTGTAGPDLVDWTLRTATGRGLDLAASLGGQGVEDGAVLLVEPAAPAVPRLRTRDVVVEAAAATAEVRRTARWGAVVPALGTALAGTAVLLTVVTAGTDPAVRRHVLVALVLLAAVTAGLAVGGVRISRRVTDPLVAHAGALALVATVAAGTVWAGRNPLAPVALLHSATGVLVVGLVMLSAPGITRAVAAAAVAAAVPVELGAVVALALRADVRAALAVTLTVATFGLVVVPRLAAAATGVTAPAADGGDAPDRVGSLEVAVRLARRCHAAASVALAALLVAVGTALLLPVTGPGGAWGTLLHAETAVLVGATLPRAGHPVVAAAAVLTTGWLVTGLVAAAVHHALPGLGAAALLVGVLLPVAVLAAAALVPLPHLPEAEGLRLLRIVDGVARVALPVFTLGAIGVLGWAWSVGRHLGGG